MKKTKFIFIILVALILLMGISNKSNAITISTSGTPSSANSGAEFSIVLKFDEKVTGFNAHISYDSSLVTMSAKSDNPYLSINPSASSEGDLALMYAPIQSDVSEDTFEIKVKATEVTSEKIAKFNVSNIEITTESSTIGETLADTSVSVTIKPVQQKSTTGTTKYTGGSLAKTGESEILLAIIGGLMVIAIFVKFKSRKMMQ